ncbi:MAG: hypothetical protein HY812_07130 [Planctomycetes bacterium]|nr:hypothetical protein [Planctomycetota bacterium]
MATPAAADAGDGREGGAAVDREQELRDLTRQSLDLLEQLAEARGRVAALLDERREAEERCARLAEMLADAGRRVRATRGVRSLCGAPAAGASLHLVFWSEGPGADEARLRDGLLAAGDYPVLVLAGREAQVEQGSGSGAALVLEPGGRSPAELWNTGMAATDAPLVLFLGPSASVARSAANLSLLARLEDEAVALGQPLLEAQGGVDTLGLVDTGDLVLERAPWPPAGASPLEFVAPEAFVVRRAAYLRIGPFDEALRGEIALAEYCLRAQSHDFQLHGVPGVRVVLAPERGAPQAEDARARDRLIALASHRPGAALAALASCGLLERLAPEEAADLTRSILERLPGAGQWRQGIDVLAAEAASLAGRALPARFIEEELQKVEQRCREMREVRCDGRSPELAALAARMEELAQEGRRAASPAGREDLRPRLRRIADELALEREAKAHLDNLVERVRLETRAVLEPEIEAARQRAQAAQAAADGRVSAVEERARAAEERARDLGAALEAVRERAYALHEKIADARSRLQAAAEAVDQVGKQKDRDLEMQRQTYETALAEIRGALHLAPDAGPADMRVRIAELQTALADRGRWIASLLAEVAERRFKLGRRGLLPHEQAFLEEHGRARSP